MTAKKKKKGAHFSADNRARISEGIRNGESKAVIARAIGSDPTSVAKEIKKNLDICETQLKLPMKDCALFKKCRHRSSCSRKCKEYVKFKCTRRDRSPGACDGCLVMSSCRYEKRKYSPQYAETRYRERLHDSRAGVNMTSSEAKAMGDFVKQFLDQGQSPYEIVTNHPELGICEKTLYNYIEADVFRISKVLPVDLRLQTHRRYTVPKFNKLLYKPRHDYSYLIGRKSEDLNVFLDEQEALDKHVSIVEMDTMYNDVSNGPFLQTFRLIDSGLSLAIYHDEKTAASMVDGLNQVEQMLGAELFEKTFTVLKTDRGTEFVDAEGLEMRADGSQRTHVFYCDAMASWQKPHVENKHIEYRYILPNKADLRALGLTSQKALNLVLSHLNSRTLKSIGDGTNSAFGYSRFAVPDLAPKFYEFGIEEVDRDYVLLKPDLLNDKKRMEFFAKTKATLLKGCRRK